MNHSPSFSTDTPLDLAIKKKLMLETLALVRVDAKQLRRGKAADKQQAADRLLRAKGRATADQPPAVSLDEMQSIRSDIRTVNTQLTTTMTQLIDACSCESGAKIVASDQQLCLHGNPAWPACAAQQAQSCMLQDIHIAVQEHSACEISITTFSTTAIKPDAVVMINVCQCVCDT